MSQTAGNGTNSDKLSTEQFTREVKLSDGLL